VGGVDADQDQRGGHCQFIGAHAAPGTVCFSRTASVGFVTIMANPMATSQDFANWVCGDELDPEYLMHALIRSRVELRALATGATHKTIYMPLLKPFTCACPTGQPSSASSGT
jgi:hypothetical protein